MIDKLWGQNSGFEKIDEDILLSSLFVSIYKVIFFFITLFSGFADSIFGNRPENIPGVKRSRSFSTYKTDVFLSSFNYLFLLMEFFCE